MNVLIISLSSTIQRTLLFDEFAIEKVNRSKTYIEDASGKALNTARVMTQLASNSCEVICSIGRTNKKRFINLIKKDKLKIHPFIIPGNTRECWTLLSETGATTEVVADEPQTNFDSIKFEIKLLKKIKNTIKTKNFDMVLLLGSSTKFYSTEIYKNIAKILKEYNLPFLADFHGYSLSNIPKEYFPNFIKINIDEYINTFCQDNKEALLKSEELLQKSIKQNSEAYNSTFIITRGTKSTIAVHKSIIYEVPIIKTEVINTTACGDSFNAGFVYEFIKSNDFHKSLIAGTHCASLNAKNIRPGSIK